MFYFLKFTYKKYINIFLLKYIINTKISTQIKEIINQLRDKIERNEIILRHIERKSLKPEEVKIKVDILIHT